MSEPIANTAYAFTVTVIDILGNPVPDAVVTTAEYRQDDGAYSAMTTTPTAQSGEAVLNCDLTAAEMNATGRVDVHLVGANFEIFHSIQLATTLKATLDAVNALSVASSPTLLVTTTVATVTSQTEFTLTAGSADDNAYKDHNLIFVDQVTSTQRSVRTAATYTGATRTVTLTSAPDFTIAAGDTVSVIANPPGASTGGGSVNHTVTIRTTAGDPIANARVWLTQDELGTVRRSADLFTNDLGQVTFTINLDVTYYLWADDGGVNEYANPQTLLVSS